MNGGLVPLEVMGRELRRNADRQPVCLVIPPSAFLLDERVFTSLGILKVAAILEEAGFSVEVLDLSGIENYEERLVPGKIDSIVLEQLRTK